MNIFGVLLMRKSLKLIIALVIATAIVLPTTFSSNGVVLAASTGFYTENSYYSPVQFKGISKIQQGELLKRADLVLVVGGNVYFAKNAIGKSDAQLAMIAISVTNFQNQYGELSPSGYSDAKVSDFYVQSID